MFDLQIGTIHLRRQQIFIIFDPHSVGIFFATTCPQIWQIIDPFHIKNAKVFNGWTLIMSIKEENVFY